MANITISGPISKRRREHNEKILAKIDPLVHKILDRLDETVNKTSFSQAAIGAGILIDKTRQLSGEALEEYRAVTRGEVESLDMLVNELKAEIVRRNMEVDVTPAKTQPEDK